jgi:transposase InsO family protein
MTGNLKLLINFVSKFIGTVRFGNDHYALIMGYGDYVSGNIEISRVYYVEGLGHNLFSVGQFCDGDLEVAFREKTCFVRDLQGNDLMSGSRGSNLYTISMSDMIASSPICLLSKAEFTKSWLWHKRLSHLNFKTMTDLARHKLVDGFPRFRFTKDHLCPACEQGKSTRAHFPSKPEQSTNHVLQLLHMDLCGPMRVQSINGKCYILVIVDDYSRWTWVYFLRSKDQAPSMIITFLTKIQVQLRNTVRMIRTDNGTEFKNQTLRSYYEKVGIEHQTSILSSPEQNGVVERRNRTLVEAARTMLIKLPDYLWAEAVSTACYTQNRCMITKRHRKTPYQIVHKRKPNIDYFHVFGALYYPKNDRDDLGKLKAKADIGEFVGYCENSKGFRIWNRRTREIQETIHANFDELTQMASEQNSLGPEFNRLNFLDSSAEALSLNRKELETLFNPLFDDTIDYRSTEVTPNSAAQPDNNQVPDSPQQTTTTVEKDGPPIASPFTVEQTASNSRQSAEDPTPQSVPQSAEYDPNAFINPFAPAPTFQEVTESSTRNLDPANM